MGKGGIRRTEDVAAELGVTPAVLREIAVPPGMHLNEKQVDDILERAALTACLLMPMPNACLQTNVLVLRILDLLWPAHDFTLRLGALTLYDRVAKKRKVAFDPRLTEEIDGFHAWVESSTGYVADATICRTLAARRIDVGIEQLLLSQGYEFDLGGFTFRYEELPDLELINEEDSEPAVLALLRTTFGHPAPRLRIDFPLDLQWRAESARGRAPR